jgi:hypothetical protein
MPCATLLDFLGIDPFPYVRVLGKIMGIERPEPFPDLPVVGEVVGKSEGKKTHMPWGGSHLGDQSMNVREKGVGLSLVIRGKEVAEVEDGCGFFLTVSRCRLGAVVTI